MAKKKKWDYTPSRRKATAKARLEHSRICRLGRVVRDRGKR